jgi:hypothetical protein
MFDMELQTKKVMLDVPFYANTTGDGNQCAQVAMRGIVKYFLGKEMSVEDLDNLTRRTEGHWTYTTQVAPALYNLGLKVKYFSKTDFTPFLQGESYIRQHYGDAAEQILKYTDIDSLIWSIENIKNYDLFELRVPKFEEIEEHIIEGHVPMVLVDYAKLSGKNGPFVGDYVNMTGFDSESVYFHNSYQGNPTPNMKIEKSKFIDAWNANGTDNDLVVVYGKR